MSMRRALRAFGVVGVLVAGSVAGFGGPASAVAPAAGGQSAADGRASAVAAAPALHVSGNRLVTGADSTFRPLGVNRSGGEFGCVQGKEIFDGPTDQAAVDAMKAWKINTVRIPLNEECWLGTGNLPPTAPTAAAYQQAVKTYADLLVANGINVILDLHWTWGEYTGPGGGCPDVAATCQKPMPDARYAPTFWSEVATMFKGNGAVIFDLFNEPYPDAANNWSDATAAWTCLRDGGTCAGITYPVAGMQTLVNAVRATGATNVIMSGGLEWTNNLSRWLEFKPADPTGNLMASWHSYNFNGCVTTSCWDSNIGAVAAQVPVQAGEIGQDTCAHDYIDRVTAWADANKVGYTAWTWNPWGCSGGNVLIEDWNGTPTTTYGEGFKAHLLSQTPGDPGGDTAAPTAPGTPTASEVTATSATLNWAASTDNVGVTGYEVVRVTGGTETQVAGSASNRATVTGLSGSTAYTFAVYAKDAAGNRSTRSAAVTITTTGTPAGTCSVGYRVVGDWGSGFQSEITIRNTGAAAVSNWKLGFTFANGQTVNNMWGGTPTQTGGSVSVIPASYTNTITADGSVTLGFIANRGATNTAPTTFTLNGRTCTTA
ncbi:cellulase family glycosylhydrolase [Streptomyces sp. AM 2-1-1]|uniref:cellulase family glycosylhydrolase n=1 Tax=Streptomyces sp. AM 2-1-1 TaxID=3028709 RepID=UPI0023B98A80|nr:cellulase family glycosylhydrolase [Streptomyces sp. AM 2-1-1]WEH43094.1 cellulase family glycosylhydrolase [Streptomyces sp. AM 2-1-1]